MYVPLQRGKVRQERKLALQTIHRNTSGQPAGMFHPADLTSGAASGIGVWLTPLCGSRLSSPAAAGGRVRIWEIERSISKSRLQSSITRILLLNPTSLAR